MSSEERVRLPGSEQHPPDPAPPDPMEILDSSAAGARVIRGSALRTASFAAGVALSIGSAALMIRQLGTVDYGRYVVVISLVSIVAGFTDVGMANVAAREIAASDRHERNRLLANLLGIRMAIATAGVVAALVFAVFAGYDSTMLVGTFLAGIGMFLTMIQHTYAIPMGVALRWGWISAIDFLRQALTVAIVVLLVLAGAGLLPFLAATIPVSLLVLAVAIPSVRGIAPLLPSFDRRQWSSIARLTGIYAAAAAVGTIYIYAAVIATSLVGSDQDAGYVGAAFRIYIVLASIPLLLVSTAFPVLARAAHVDRERLEYALGRVFQVAVIVGTWMALATVLGASFAIAVVAGEGFEPSVGVLQIQGLALVPSFLATAAAFALVSLRLNVGLLVANAVALSSTVVLTLVLVPLIDAKGAAVAMLTGDCVLVILLGITLARADALFFDLGVVPRVAVAAGLAALLALAPVPDLVAVVAATVVYFGVLALLRGIPPEIRDVLMRRTARA
jgi:O-antigen/teichoic acid export membrane protein